MDPNQPNPPILSMETVWAAGSFAPAEAISTDVMTNYPFTLTQTLSGASSEIDQTNVLLDLEAFPEAGAVGVRSRYYSLDFDRADMDISMPLSRRRSLTDDVKESAKERRRTQNRFAQRAYRQRKEQAMKDQEKEIEELKLQLAKEKKLNQTLAKVIEFLKERLKTMPPQKEKT